MRVRFKWLAVGGLLLGVLLLSALTWLCTSEAPVTWLAERLSVWTEGRIQVDAVRGSLSTGLRLGTLQIKDIGFVLRGRDVQLAWSPGELLQGRLVIDRLHLDDLSVTLKPNASPSTPQQPKTLRLPLAAQIKGVTIDRLHIIRGEKVQEWRDLGARWQADSRQHNAQVTVAASPWGSGEAELTLATTPPFSMTGSAALTELPLQNAAKLTASLGGSLVVPTITLHGVSGGTTLRASMTLTPFADIPWQALDLAVDGLALREWQPKAPLGTFAVNLQATCTPNGQMQGRVHVNNAEAGPTEEQRLPLQALSSAIAGTWPTVHFDDIKLDLGPAGRFAGNGRWQEPELTLHLLTESFNLQGLHRTLLPTALRGNINLHALAARQSVSLMMAADDKKVSLEAAYGDNTLRVEKLQLRADGGAVSASGQVGLVGQQQFALSSTLQDFNPAAYGHYPKGRINADLGAVGQVMPALVGQAHWTLHDSQIEGRPITGQGRIERQASDRLSLDAKLDLLGNRLTAQGTWGVAQKEIVWNINAPKLALLQLGVQGAIDGHGTLGGALAQPAGQLTVAARDLHWLDGQRVANLQASARLDNGDKGSVSVGIDAQGVHAKQVQIDSLLVRLQGQVAQHDVTLSMKGPELALSGLLRGGWRDAAYKGQLLQLRNTGMYSVELLRPATLSWSKQKFELDQTDLRLLDEGEVAINQLLVGPETWSTKGSIVRFPMAPLWTRFPVTTLARSDLVLAGHWSLHGGRDVQGEAELKRSSGDLVVAGDEPLPLVLRELNVSLRLQPQLASLSALVQGDRIGHVDLAGYVRVRAQELRSSPIKLRAQANVPSLAWLKLLNPRIEPDGQLQATLDVNGTLAKPLAHGVLRGQGLSIAVPEEGVALDNGTLQLALDGARLQVQEFGVRSGEGTLSAQGAVSLDEQVGTLQYTLKTFTLMSRPDREAVLSGNGRLQTQGDAVVLDGAWQFDKGRFELQDANRPVLGKDVVVVGDTGQAEAQSLRQPVPLRVRLAIDMGEHFAIEGRGVQAKLIGKLRVNAAPGRVPRAFGTIYVDKGLVRQYGQELAVENGAVNFNGPVDNPGLNITARRKRSETGWTANDEVDVRVVIGGTAGKPKVSLVSTPVVPDSEKLAWLVLGHGLQGAERAELDALGAAAAALLSGDDSSSLQAKLANAIGVEEVGVRRDATQQQTFATLGKRISSRAYLTLEQALGGASSLAKLRYQLTQRWSLQATTGTESALDMFYNWRFN